MGLWRYPKNCSIRASRLGITLRTIPGLITSSMKGLSRLMSGDSAMSEFLPAEFKLGHDLAFVLHDLLTEHIVEGERAGLLWFEVRLSRPEDGKAMKNLEGEEFWHWCEANGYRHV